MKQFIFLATTVLLLTACSSSQEKEEKKDPVKKAAPQFQFATADTVSVNSEIKLPGQLAAYEEVSIFPKVNGYVKTVLVDIGTRVRKGQLLMTLEAPELDEASLQAKEKYTRAKTDLSISEEQYQRLLEASKTAGAVSPLDISTAKSKVEANTALMNAEKANWQMQQTMLSYLQVTAPFDGNITERNVHPGALVSNAQKDKPMLELKQVSRLRLQVDIPEAIGAVLKDNDKVSFFLTAFPGKKFTGSVSRQADNVNIQYRSERMEIDVANTDGVLAPGMYADVIVDSKGTPGALRVPKTAVITSTERKYVVAVRNGKTIKVDVRTGNENASVIEVIGDLKAGEKIIANPNDEIKEGIAVE
jgi:RND family efflux transporter MFP subunit